MVLNPCLIPKGILLLLWPLSTTFESTMTWRKAESSCIIASLLWLKLNTSPALSQLRLITESPTTLPSSWKGPVVFDQMTLSAINHSDEPENWLDMKITNFWKVKTHLKQSHNFLLWRSSCSALLTRGWRQTGSPFLPCLLFTLWFS